MAGIFPQSSVGTIFDIVLAPSANISSQFVVDMLHYEGISSSLDLKWISTIGPSPTGQYFIRVSASQLQSFKVHMWMLFCCDYHCCSLLARPAPAAYLTDHQ